MGTDARLRSPAFGGYKRDGRRSMQDAGTDGALPIGSAVCRTVPVSLSDYNVARNDTRSSTKLRPLGLYEAKIITVWLLAVRFTSERSAGRKENRNKTLLFDRFHLHHSHFRIPLYSSLNRVPKLNDTTLHRMVLISVICNSNKKAQLTLSNPRDVKACQNCSNSTCFVSFHRIPFPQIANA